MPDLRPEELQAIADRLSPIARQVVGPRSARLVGGPGRLEVVYQDPESGICTCIAIPLHPKKAHQYGVQHARANAARIIWQRLRSQAMAAPEQVLDPKDWECITCGKPLTKVVSSTADLSTVAGDCPQHGRVWAAKRKDVQLPKGDV